jgi:hypothetical protein
MTMSRPCTLLLTVASALLSTSALAGGPGTNCPTNPSTQLAGDVQPAVFTNLQPGVGYNLPPTNAGVNPDLDGATVLTYSLPFTFGSGPNVATGVFNQVIGNSTFSTSKCAANSQVSMSSTSTAKVCAFRIYGFNYPAPLPVYAARRTDSSPAADVAGRKVKRSTGLGTVVRFQFDRCLDASEVSEQLVLVFESPQVGKDSLVQFESDTAGLSSKLKIYGPRLP